VSRVYVVVTLDGRGDITDLEVLDQEPRWDTEDLGQVVYEANVNGGDSTRIYMGDPEG
jgi:hypothetical protein